MAPISAVPHRPISFNQRLVAMATEQSTRCHGDVNLLLLLLLFLKKFEMEIKSGRGFGRRAWTNQTTLDAKAGHH